MWSIYDPSYMELLASVLPDFDYDDDVSSYTVTYLMKLQSRDESILTTPLLIYESYISYISG